MSTSSAPKSTTARTSATLSAVGACPDGKRGRDGRDLDAASPGAGRRGRRHEVRVDADRGDRRDAAVDRVGTHRLRAERRDLAGRVGALERRQVHHADGELERLQLRLLLDRPLRKLAGTRLERDGVDRADPRQPRLQRKLEATRECRCLRHRPECSWPHLPVRPDAGLAEGQTQYVSSGRGRPRRQTRPPYRPQELHAGRLARGRLPPAATVAAGLSAAVPARLARSRRLPARRVPGRRVATAVGRRGLVRSS